MGTVWVTSQLYICMLAYVFRYALRDLNVYAQIWDSFREGS